MRSFTVLASASLLIIVFSARYSSGQKKNEPPLSQLCTRTSALDIIQQQNSSAKTFDNIAQRIAVMVRVADMTWPYQQAKARAIFTEAFDFATADFKEKGDQTTRNGRMPVQLPDQRFLVIGAVAKRDLDWARKLSEQALQDTNAAAEEKTKKNLGQNDGEKMLSVALSLADSDPSSAAVYARGALRYPASLYLSLFIYKLADKNKPAADSFYVDALAAYANAPMDQFLYLSSYPFANNREAGEMPGWTTYAVPATVRPNPVLQRSFIQALLQQAQTLGQRVSETLPGSRYSEASQIWTAISRLENQVQSSLPDLSPALQEAKGGMFVLMSQKDQKRTADSLIEPPAQTFAERIEQAEKQTDPGRRESGIAFAILGVKDDEPLEAVVAAADKLEDQSLRAQLLSRFYFNRAKALVKLKQLDEARRLASKVDNLDHRAYLYSLIVEQSIKDAKNDTDAREVLEEVVTVTSKAPNTEVKARALLAVAYLFAKVDPLRSITVLGDAVKTINQIENPDFSRDFIMTRIEGKQFGSYSQIRTPGFNPENAFREMSKFDFDGLLYQAGQFSNKSLRSMTTLALVEPCLLQTAPAKKPTIKTTQAN